MGRHKENSCHVVQKGTYKRVGNLCTCQLYFRFRMQRQQQKAKISTLIPSRTPNIYLFLFHSFLIKTKNKNHQLRNLVNVWLESKKLPYQPISDSTDHSFHSPLSLDLNKSHLRKLKIGLVQDIV